MAQTPENMERRAGARKKAKQSAQRKIRSLKKQGKRIPKALRDQARG